MILFICSRNYTRSPAAEAVYRNVTGKPANSAGYKAAPDSGINPTTIVALNDAGFNLSRKSNQQVTEAMVKRATVVVCLEAKHVTAMRKKFPAHKDKVMTIQKFTGHSISVPSPWHGKIKANEMVSRFVKHFTPTKATTSVLYLCDRNTTRSPAAVSIMRQLAPSGISVSGAGLPPSGGVHSAYNPVVLAELKERGYRKPHGVPRLATASIISRAGLVLTMTAAQATRTAKAFPEHADRIMTLSKFAGGSGDIPDPKGDKTKVATTLTRLESLIKKVVTKVVGKAISGRQREIIGFNTTLVESEGKFNKGVGGDGAHYIAEAPEGKRGIRCGNCVVYEPDGRSCQWVTGDISPASICKLWIIDSNLISN